MARILIVEDSKDLVFGLRTTLEMEGHEVFVAETGPDGVTRASAHEPDLVLLDVMLPGFDGFRVIRTLREAGFDAPVLMLTARGEQDDKVRGLRLGADDYVTKPFGAMELLARVDALLRRPRSRRAMSVQPSGAAVAREPARPLRTIQIGADIEIDPDRCVVRRGGATVTLTPKAYDLLLALVEREGAVAKRDDLLRDVWGYRADVSTRTVDIHVAELRRKLEEDSSDPQHILTVRKVGYRLER